VKYIVERKVDFADEDHASFSSLVSCVAFILCVINDAVRKRWLPRLEDGNGDLSAIADAFNILHHRFVSIIRIVPSKRLLLARLSTSNPRTNIKPKNIPAAKAKYKTSFIQTTSIISFYY